MGETMRAVDIKGGKGPASALFINSSVPKPKPGANECLVRVKAFGLNRADTSQRQGNYPPLPGITDILGLEISGVIEEVGAEVGKGDGTQAWKKGDEVFALLYGGGYAEYVVVHQRMLVEKPKDWSWEYAAGLSEVWFTALQALYLVGGFDPSRMRAILWHAGASSVSIAGIQLSKNAHRYDHHTSATSNLPTEPKVFATSRTDSKCFFCISRLHCTGAVNTGHPNWVEEIKKQNDGNGIDLIIDFVGAPYFQSNLDLLAQDGRVVMLGLMGGSILPDKVNVGTLLRKRARVEGSTLRSRSLEYQIRLRDLFVEKVMPGLLDGTYEHHTEKVFDWEDVVLAHEMMERNETKGKLVCVIN